MSQILAAACSNQIPQRELIPGIREFSIKKQQGTVADVQTDRIAIEEPLDIRIVITEKGKRKDRSISITMRTPGTDEHLAIGFLLSEGIISRREDVARVRLCRSGSIVRVFLNDSLQVDLKRLQRHFFTSSSCGVCGKASIDAVTVQIPAALCIGFPRISHELIGQLPQRLRFSQILFEQTGGLHASGLFNSQGDLLSIAEDVGRHNALDKVIGGQWLTDAAVFEKSILVVSGRISFELVQKALSVGIPIIIAVGAPSSLAVELAQRHEMTLVGFTSRDRFNIYHDASRIASSVPSVINHG
tara:strand:- start:1433 stop:2335 length:903 start_codon:yes stop_codon:yes gene_type:complete